MNTKNTLSHKNKWLFGVLALVLPLIYHSSFLSNGANLRFLFGGICVFVAFFFLFKELKNQSLFLTKNQVLFFGLISIYLLFVLFSSSKSTNLGDAFFELSKSFLFLILVFYFFLFIKNNKNIYRFAARLFSMVLILNGLFGILQHFKFIKVFRKVEFGISALQFNPNINASFTLLLLPFMLWLFLKSKNKTWKNVALLASILALLNLYFTYSNTFYFVFILMILGSFFFFRKRLFQTKKTLTSSLAIAFIAVFFLATKFNQNNFDSAISSLNERISLWQKTSKLIQKSPFLGNGISDWKIEVLDYGTENLIASKGKRVFFHPHNDWISIAAENGLLASLAFLSAFLFLFWMLFKKLKSGKNTIAFCLLLSLLVYVFDSMLNFPKNQATHLFCLALLAGFILNFEREKKGKKIPLKPFLLVFLILSLAISFVFFKRFQNESKFEEARFYFKKNNPKKTLEQLKQVNYFYYPIDVISGEPTLSYLAFYQFQNNKIQQAKNTFEEALATHPKNCQSLARVANFYSEIQDFQEAEKYYQKSISVCPCFYEARLDWSVLYYRNAEYKKAYETLEKVCEQTETSQQYLEVYKEKFKP